MNDHLTEIAARHHGCKASDNDCDVPTLLDALNDARGKLAEVEKQAQRHTKAQTVGPEYNAGMQAAGRDILRILRESEVKP